MSLTWDSGLESGVAKIDEQHRELFAAINQLLSAMQDSRGAAEVVRLLAFLEEYVVEHFGMEEQLMRVQRYPDVARHTAEHQRFVEDFLALKADLAGRGASSSLVIQVNSRVCAWLRGHIATSDRALGAYVRARTGAARVSAT